MDRVEAGRELAKQLRRYRNKAVIFALPRGGVVLGAEVAKALEVPLDLILVRKIGYPGYEEYAIGAVAEGSEPVWNEAEVQSIDEDWIQETLTVARKENQRRRHYFPTDYQPPSVTNKTAIIIDDGIATGLTMKAAVKAVKKDKPKAIVVAVPVAPDDSVENLKALVDDVVVLDNPDNFAGAVGAHYQNFPQVEDDAVISLLTKNLKRID